MVICFFYRLGFYTTTGVKKHSCEKKRRRPEKDFRTYDVRHCKYCNHWFPSLDENRAHQCEFQFSYDIKIFRCRICLQEFSKNSYNKHMTKHSAKRYVCDICDKTLADERALNLHLTVHSGQVNIFIFVRKSLLYFLIYFF